MPQEAAAERAGGWKRLFAARRAALREADPWLRPSSFEVEVSGERRRLAADADALACLAAAAVAAAPASLPTRTLVCLLERLARQGGPYERCA